jgi:invasion protein IalB
MTTRPAEGRTIIKLPARAVTGILSLAVSFAALAPLASAAQTPLPGGAQSVAETYQDWQMVCTQPQGGKRCVVGQQQSDSKSGQRILAVELQPQGDKAEGVLLLPFGLTLDKGVSLRIGEAEIGPALRFKTCVMQGCVVPVTLDAKALAALRKGTALTVNATSDVEPSMAFSISLKRFGSALDRATTLAR